jgi:2',3'-cyclic-nucleotide 2'-phosphodiesterase (5'-nucleotidase family)
VDTGDFFGQAGEQDSLKSAFMIDAMSRLGYDVVALGERELNFGQKLLLDGFRKTKIDVVCSNLVFRDDQKPLVKPYVIRRAGDVRVAFFGLMAKDLRLRTQAGERPLEIQDPFETARRLLPELRKKADIVVLLSHVGLTEGQRLTLEVPGIDVMVFGHQVGLFREVAKTNGVVNVRSGDRGQHVPMIHLVVQDRKIASYDGEVVALDAKIPGDEAMTQLVDAMEDELNRRTAQANTATTQQAEAGTTAVITRDHYLGEKTCRRCHEAQYQMMASHPHSHAWETLVKEQRDSSPECIRCHVLAYGQAGGFVSKAGTPDLVNVQCESCHGMGTRHDEMVEGKMTVGPAACAQCHTAERSPGFHYDEALERIKHWE